MTRRRSCLLPVALALVLLIIAGAGAAAYFFFLRPRAGTAPIVLIHSPRDGTRLEVGQEVVVHSSARDDRKVQRIELWADGTLVHSESSTIPGGTSPFPLLVRWQPTAPGTHTLTVRAFDSQGGRANASVEVEAASVADRDGDGVPDATDACPDQSGSAAAQGCPDRDGDGIADAQDACPDRGGTAASSGCPVATMTDRDGDGAADSVDACPDLAGSLHTDGCPDADGDGVADSSDSCPSEPGLPESGGCPTPGDTDGDGVADASDTCPGEAGPASTGGCPDGDGDGVANASDGCPEEAGLPALGGCPDRDADGVRDSDDLCPDVAGPVSNGGCPDSGAGDRDGDGLADDVDTLCPDEPGTAEHAGCPPAGEGSDTDGDGVAEDAGAVEDTALDLSGIILQAYALNFRNVEVQALEFETDRTYDNVNCYVSLADRPEERYGPFDSLGANHWNIAEYLGGANSARFVLAEHATLRIHVECGGEDISYFAEGAEGTYYDLGAYDRTHISFHLDGRVVETSESEGGDAGHWFRLKYRLCSPSCEESALQAPILGMAIVAGERFLAWDYTGNRDEIMGFWVYVNGARVQHVDHDTRNFSIAGYAPTCGETYRYHVTAFRFDPIGITGESSPSGTVSWTSPPCPRTVRVTFQLLTTRELCCEATPVGPIAGAFRAGDQVLEYNGAHVEHTGGIHGVWLDKDHTYYVQNILRTIATMHDNCMGDACADYTAPWDNYVTVHLDGGQDLSYGAYVLDVDHVFENVFTWWKRTSQTACQVGGTIPAAELAPGDYVAHGDNCDLGIVVQDVSD